MASATTYHSAIKPRRTAAAVIIVGNYQAMTALVTILVDERNCSTAKRKRQINLGTVYLCWLFLQQTARDLGKAGDVPVVFSTNST
ncbi:hypothetical protein L9G15_13950 [Shewanella sp. A3A]|nr:hypothetical protein [Shewanella ferrihydritica]